METAGREVGKIETRLRQLGTKLDRLVAETEAAGTAVETEYRRQIDQAKDKQAVVHGKLKAFRTANGEKWDNFKGGVASAWRDLEDAFRAIKH
jgi:hypothetical protein